MKFFKNSRIWETQNVLTNADNSTNTFFFVRKILKKFNPEPLFVFKALRIGPQMLQSNTSYACTIFRAA